ncbi:MAG: hypothetical protein JKY13_00310 [Gammaproteobacteria bacterium]|nr:hypothetical protein [Gammaproteobacteria bacterium]
MKSDISRNSFNPEKRYSAVYQQQGRIVVDADQNEFVDTIKHTINETFKDIVGNGAPDYRSLLIHDVSGKVKIQPGIMYVDGLRTEVIGASSDRIALNAQDDFPGNSSELYDSTLLSELTNHVVYIDAWERMVDATEDSDLSDPSLGGADTSVRSKVMAQVKLIEYQAIATDKDEIEQEINDKLAALPSKGNATLTVGPQHDGNENFSVISSNHLFRLEVQAVDKVDNPQIVTLKWSMNNAIENHTISNKPDAAEDFGPVYEVYDVNTASHVGVHPHAMAVATLSTLEDDLDQVTGNSDQFVRAWDGFCTVDLAVPAIPVVPAMGISRNLTVADVYIDVDNNQLVILQNDLEINLDLSGKTFVVGDYWQVPIREAQNLATSNYKFVEALEPQGIEHHYAALARIDDSNVLKSLVKTFTFQTSPVFNGNVTLGSDADSQITVTGDLIVQGKTTTINTEDLTIEDNIIELNRGEVGDGVSKGFAGIEINRGPLTANHRLLFRELDDTFIVGEVNSEKVIATREDNSTDQGVAVWNEADKRFDTEANFVYTTGGKVGINTTNPQVRLHVAGNNDANLGDTSGLFVVGDIEGDNLVFDNNEIMARNNGVASALYLQNEGGLTKFGGNVGIGTSAPQVKLHIQGGSTPILDSGSVTGGLIIGDTSSANLAIGNNKIMARSGSGENALLQLQSLDGKTYFGGNVGIGDNVDPKVKLHIRGGETPGLDTTSGYLVIGNMEGDNLAMGNDTIMARNNGVNAELKLQGLNGKTHFGGNVGIGTSASSSIHLVIGDSDTGLKQQGDGELAIYTNNSERVRVGSDGKIGIGTNDPQVKLHIEGNKDADLGDIQGLLVVGQINGYNLVFDNNEIMARNDGEASGLYMQGTGGLTRFGGNMAIGSQDPKNKLDIGGGAVIGASYSGSNTAPSNGLLVQGNVGIGTATPAGNLHVYGGSGNDTTVIIKADDTHNAVLELKGSSQGTGRVYVGQSDNAGGGIEYNGNGEPSTTGAGDDYFTLWRRETGVDHWTARNKYDSNDWEFRGLIRKLS